MQVSQFQANGALAAQNVATSTLTDVTALTLALVAGITYRYKAFLQLAPANATMGYKVIPAFSGTASTHNWLINIYDPVAVTLKQTVFNAQASSSALNQNYVVMIEGVVRVTAGGNVTIQIGQLVADANNLAADTMKSIEAWPIAFA